LDGLINDLIFGELGIVPGSFRLTILVHFIGVVSFVRYYQ